jgi:aminoglycoside phosphotransferase (APT) family kinase protein
MVSFARLLEDLDFPAVRPAPYPEAQPVEILGRQVSVWTWIDRDDGAGKDFRAFGSLLRRLHAEVGTTAITMVPSFDPMTKIARRLERLRSGTAIPDPHLHVLEAAFDRASACAETLVVAHSASVVLHGDALIGNSVSSGGRLFLIDFDSVGHGHPAWDLAPTLVSARRLRGSERDWSDFVDGYGPGSAGMAEIEAAAVVKQLSMTVALCLNRGFSDAVDDELDHRIRCWANWDFETHWRSPSLRPPSP